MSEVIDSALVELGLQNNLSGPLAAAVEEARAELDALGRKKVEIKVKADTDQALRDLKELEAETKSLEKARNDLAKQKTAPTSADQNAQRQALKDLDKKILDTKRDTDAARENAQAHQDALRKFQQISAMTNNLQAQNVKNERASTAAAKERAAADDFANSAALRRAETLSKSIKLQNQYATAQKKVQDLDKAYNRAQGSDKVRVAVSGAGAMADMERIREELSLMGDKPIDIKTKVDTPNSSGVKGFLKSITGGEDPRGLRDIGSEIGTLGSKMKSARVNIGPFSTSLSTVLVAGSALAPVITGLIGTVGALGGAVGAGLGGALGVGGAAMTGFGMATLGVVAAVKPFVSQVQNARKYQAAYNDVVSKYGAGSKQATAAQKVLNHEMSTVPKQAREAAEGFTDLSNRWKSMVGAVATHDMGNMIGASLKTASADMKWFGNDTKSTLNAVSQGWSGWMEQLRSPKMSGALNNIFKNFNSSIPNVMSGLGSLGDAFTQVMSSFSNFLPSLGHGFDSWAKGIDDAATKSHGFASGVKTMVNAMQSLGHFTSAAGKVLLSFFKAGSGSGVGLINNMTTGLNHLAASMNTVAGQKKLGDFFSRSIGTTKELWGTITSLGGAFAAMGAALRPVSTVMLAIVTGFAKLVGLAASFKPFDWVVGGVGALLLINKMTAGIREAYGLMKGIGLAMKAFAVTGMGEGGLKAAFGNLKGVFGAGTGAGTAAASQILASMEEGGATAGSTIAAEMEGAGAAVGAEIRGAMVAGGATDAAESAAAREVPAAAPIVSEAAPVAEAAAPVAEDVGAAGVGVAAGEAAKEVESLTPALEDAGGAFSALAPEIALPVLGIAGLIAGLTLLGHTTDDATKAEQGLAQIRGASKSETQNIKSTADNPSMQVGAAGQSLGGSAADQLSVNAASAAYYKLVREGKKDTDAGRSALAAYNDALTTQGTNQQAASKFVKQSNDDIKAQVALQSGDAVKAQTGLTKAQDAYNDALKTANKDASGENGRAGLMNRAHDMDQLAKTQKTLTDAQKTYNDVQQKAITLANADATAKLNVQRQLQGLVPVADKYSQSVGSMTRALASAGPAGAAALAQLSKTPDPAKVVAVAKAYNQLGSAADKTKAMNIIANTSNPTQAIARINSLVIKEKVVKVTASAGQAIAGLAKVQGIKLTAKEQKILSTGGPAAIAKVAQLAGIKVPDKVLHLLGDASKAMAAHQQVQALGDIKKALTILGINAAAKTAHAAIRALSNISKSLTVTGTNTDAKAKHAQVESLPNIAKALTITGDASSAISAAAAAKAAMAGVHSVSASIDVVTNFITHGSPAAGAPSSGAGHRAQGGTRTSSAKSNPALAAVQAHAARIASVRGPKKTQGGLYSGPQYLVGEENKPEYVIATNPAYRERNKRYVAQAAEEFGMHIDGYAMGTNNVQAAAKKAKPKPKGKPKPKFNSIYDLPAGDRIGGIDTSDIDSAVTTASGDVSTWQGNLKTLNRQKTTDQTEITRLKTIEKSYPKKDKKGKITSKWKDTSYSADLTRYQNDLNKVTSKKGGNGTIVQAKNKLGHFQTWLNQVTKLDQKAKFQVNKFNNLEGEISAVGQMMDAAGSKTEDTIDPKTGKVTQKAYTAYGYDPEAKKETMHSWEQWRDIEVRLEKTHTNWLRNAFADVQKIMKNYKPDASLTYVSTLENALGTSLADLSTDENAIDPSLPSVTDAASLGPTPESLSDFLSGIDPAGNAIAGLGNQEQTEAALQYAITDAGNRATANPGDPAGLALEQTAAQNLLNFYENTVMPEAKGWVNPTFSPPAVDYDLLNDVASAISGAQQTLTGIQASSQGPSQAQLTSTAQSALMSTYGSNAADTVIGGNAGGLFAAAMGMSPTDMTEALAGGQVAAQTMAADTSSAVVSRMPVTSQAQAAPTVQEGHTVINNYQQPPEDPHTWSKGIAFELGAMA